MVPTTNDDGSSDAMDGETVHAPSVAALVIGIILLTYLARFLGTALLTHSPRMMLMGLPGVAILGLGVAGAAVLVRRQGPAAVGIAAGFATLFQMPFPISPFHSVLAMRLISPSSFAFVTSGGHGIAPGRMALLILVDVVHLAVMAGGAYLLARSGRWQMPTPVIRSRRNRRIVFGIGIGIFLVPLLGAPFGAMGIGLLAMLCLPVAIPLLLAYAAAGASGLVVRTLKI